jgi:hypothetical protein
MDVSRQTELARLLAALRREGRQQSGLDARLLPPDKNPVQPQNERRSNCTPISASILGPMGKCLARRSRRPAVDPDEFSKLLRSGSKQGLDTLAIRLSERRKAGCEVGPCF